MTLSEIESTLTIDDKQMNLALETYIPQLTAKLTSADAKAKYEDKINAFKTLQKYYNNLKDGTGISYYVDGAKRINIITSIYVGEEEVMKLLPYQVKENEAKLEPRKKAAYASSPEGNKDYIDAITKYVLEDRVSNTLLSIVHEVVNELSNLYIAINWIWKDHTLLWFCFSHCFVLIFC